MADLKAFNSNNLTATDPTFVRGGSGWGDYYVKSYTKDSPDELKPKIN